MFDWRGPSIGYMWGDQLWFWSFYKVKAITVDVSPNKVKTNMHQANETTFVPLSQVTTMAQLTQLNPADGNGSKTYTFNLDAYNSAAQNAALKTYMDNNKALFGGFTYYNNGDNVDHFDLQIPISVEYEWGTFNQTVTWKIRTTAGQVTQ